MIRKIFGTFGTRVLNAICNFVTLWFGTHYLGAEAWGIGGIVLLDVSLLLIGVEFLAGSGLIYFTPRKSYRTLFKISYIWSALIVAFYALLMYLFSFIPESFGHHFAKFFGESAEFVPEGYHGMVLLLVFVYSLHNFNLTTMLGKERVGTNNILFIIQFMTQMCSMLIYIFVFDIRDANAFVYSFLTGYIVSYICGLTQIWPYLKDPVEDSLWDTIKEMFKFGTIIQLSTLVTMLNRRLSFLIIKGFWGDAKVGVYSAASQVSEAPKMIGQSIAMVQFSKISNLTDNDLAAKITVQLLKIATILTAICIFIVCVIPTSVYSWLFTSNFAEMRVVMIALGPGVVFMAANMVFSHYFSGMNMPKHNLYGALVGLAVTIPSLYLLIPPLGMVGAGISASLTNLAIIVYQWVIFKKINKISAKELLVTKEDVKLLVSEIKSLLGK
ncbi:MAG: polysaccharide biosynthesis C-terminal domain-containing protein [Bacteroidales bacterium]|nr:polysaccharide biosynthesis C-terminal domain-containing protein [Bacteroidales bacterium]